MAYGLTAAGLNPKPQAQIITDMQTVQLAQISTSLDVTPTGLIGVLNGVISADLADCWNLLAALYSGIDPNNATGDQLTSVALLTGTARNAATFTVVVGCTVTVTGALNQAPGTMFASVAGNPIALFTNQTQVTFGGAGSGSFNFIAVNAGAVQALGSTMTVISVPITNWSAITNATAGVIGSPIETDSALRIRRQTELATAGSSTAAAIQAAVIKHAQPGDAKYATTTPTLSCTVLYNDGDIVDANGLLPHSVEVIAYQPGSGNQPADDQALANLIAAYKSAGINTNGTTTKSVTDSQGQTETIKLTRPTTLTVNIALTVVTGTGFTTNSDIKDAIAGYAQGTTFAGIPVAGKTAAWTPGATIYAFHTLSSAFIPGVLDITSFTMNGGGSNITSTVRQVAVLGTITVTP